MDINKSLYCPDFILTDQITRRIFEVLPESGPLMVIMNTQGKSHVSNPEDFFKLNISESFLQDICIRIDDGAEPIITNINDCSIVAGQLATEQSNFGYVFIVLPQYNPESILGNFDLIEMLLNQANLIAELVEKNNVHYEVRQKDFWVFSQSEAAFN